MMFFALWKIIAVIFSRELLLSKYTIMAIIAGFVIAGFIYGIIAYSKRNHHYKIYSMTWKNFLIDILLTIIFTAYFWYVLRNRLVPSSTVFIFAIVVFILFYAFSALISHMHSHIQKKRHKKLKTSTIVFAILFNPIFVLIYFWIFSLVVYNSVYIPCTVSIIGIDKNPYTMGTRNLNIGANEQIVSIDGVPIHTLQDVRDYMDGLGSTKQVSVETTNQTYLIQTYQIDDRRYMGLLLQENICERKY
jgi:heme/copper-type cytochrome/quinol oxidase subunit 4